jgi:MFS family permease
VCAYQDESGRVKEQKESIWSFPYIALMVVNLFQSMAAFMANTTLPVYADTLGASPSVVGIVVSSFSVTALLTRPFAGPAFDSFSRKRLLMASQCIICACMFLYGVVDSLQGLVIVRLVHGIGIGCSGPLAMSLVSEFLPESRFASGISIYALAQSFAQVVGPAAGLYLVNAIGFSPSYFLAAGCLLVAICGVGLIREPYRERLRYELKLDRMFAPEAVGKGVALMLLATSFSCMGAYVVLYGYSVGVSQMGVFFIVYAFCLLGTRPLFGSMADRFGAPRMLAVGIAFFAASYVALAVADNLVAFIIAAILGSAGFGCCGPLLQSAALASVPPSRRGAASNTAFTGLDLGMLIGPIIGGMVIEAATPILGSQPEAYSLMWLAMLVPAIGASLIVLRWNLQRRQDMT